MTDFNQLEQDAIEAWRCWPQVLELKRRHLQEALDAVGGTSIYHDESINEEDWLATEEMEADS